MKTTITNVTRNNDGTLTVTYSTGTVKTFHGKAPQTVYTWLRQNVDQPKREAKARADREFIEREMANPTTIRSIETLSDGRFRVTYKTGRKRTFKKETLPSTAYRYWEFEKNYRG